jgi:ABC-2 type transport system permease protein
MKIVSLLSKSLKEQIRSFWVLLLSLSMGPFFIFIYFLITETSKPQYTVLIANQDRGMTSGDSSVNHGKELLLYFHKYRENTMSVPFTVMEIRDERTGIERVRSKKADALVTIDDHFSQAIERRKAGDSLAIAKVAFTGDLTSTGYLLSAVWANEIMNEYTLQSTHQNRAVEVTETALGSSGSVSSFDMMVPGILIVSLIMLMFTASIAFVSEVEYRTIMRLKLSKLTSLEFLGGITLVQLMVGVLSMLLTLLTAILLGFQYAGSLSVMIFIAVLTSISIIAFSLIIAAVTKSATEVLVVGNFPMFLFMFFTGAAFPLNSDPWFTVAGYPVNLQGLMTPTHAISALNKTLIMNMDFSSIVPEIISIVALTLIYFAIGGLIFRHRHLKLA